MGDYTKEFLTSTIGIVCKILKIETLEPMQASWLEDGWWVMHIDGTLKQYFRQ